MMICFPPQGTPPNTAADTAHLEARVKPEET